MPTKTKKKALRPDQINVVLDQEHRDALERIVSIRTHDVGEKQDFSKTVRWLIRRTDYDLNHSGK